MSIRLDLDDSLIRVAPTLDDVEAVLLVRTRFAKPANEGVDGLIRKASAGRKNGTFAPQMVVASNRLETRLGLNDAKGCPEYQTRTLYHAGGADSTFVEMDRRVWFMARWHGEGNRYLELRLRTFPGAVVVANRGMALFGENFPNCNFLEKVRGGEWVEIHYDNHTHVGLSMRHHTTSDDFHAWRRPEMGPSGPLARSRFDRI